MGLSAQVELRLSLAGPCALPALFLGQIVDRSKAVNDQLTYLLFYIDIHRRNDRYNKMRRSKHMPTQVFLKRAKENQNE